MLRLLAEKGKMAKYALVGLSNTGVDFAVFCLLVYLGGASPLWAQPIAYGAGLANSYLLNRHWTFRSAAGVPARGSPVRFVVVNVVSFGAATAVLLALTHAGAPAAWAKAVSIAGSLALNYVGYRLWVFGGEKDVLQ